MIMQKRVVAIHDISCFGKCSLTVALPVISAAGIECSCIPTAVLSTHTGDFKGYTFRNLTDDILPIANHWKKEKIRFDAVYTGYLGSAEQVDIVCRVYDMLKNDNTLLIVDPVMADHGKLYGGFEKDFPQKMIKLCKKADIITPNITEAAFMTGIPYADGLHTENYIKDLMNGLKQITDGKIVLTGVSFKKDEIGVACAENGKTEYIFTPRIDAVYHGTGDVFASALTCGIMKEKSLAESVLIAAKYTAGCINQTRIETPDVRYGVNFEGEIPNLLKLLEII